MKKFFRSMGLLLLIACMLCSMPACAQQRGPSGAEPPAGESEASELPSGETDEAPSGETPEEGDGGEPSSGEEEGVSSGPQPSAATFTEHSYAAGEVTVQYCLYTPANAAEGLPMIVYLHGGSAKGAQLSLVYQDGFPKYVREGTLQPGSAYVLIPQLASAYRGWEEIADELVALIGSVAAERGVDRAKISLTGHSMGGTGTWSLGIRYPHTFSCIAPLSGSVRITEENVLALSSLPVRAFAGSADTLVSPEVSKRMVGALRDAGGDAGIVVLEGATHHDVPELAYLGDYGLIGWLTAQTRQN